MYFCTLIFRPLYLVSCTLYLSCQLQLHKPKSISPIQPIMALVITQLHLSNSEVSNVNFQNPRASPNRHPQTRSQRHCGLPSPLQPPAPPGPESSEQTMMLPTTRTAASMALRGMCAPPSFQWNAPPEPFRPSDISSPIVSLSIDQPRHR